MCVLSCNSGRFLDTSLSDDKTDKKGYKDKDDTKNTIKKCLKYLKHCT